MRHRSKELRPPAHRWWVGVAASLSLVAFAAWLITAWLATPAPNAGAAARATALTQQPERRQHHDPLQRVAHAPTRPARETLPLPVETPMSLAAQFNQAPNLLAFVNGLLPAARRGDAQAQYFVYKSINFCAGAYAAYFEDGPPAAGGPHRTLEEALRLASAQSPPVPWLAQEMRSVHARCHALVNTQAAAVGDPSQWLRRAAHAGHPLAQAAYAQAEIHRIELASTTPVDGDKARIQNLLANALRSKQPDVLWAIGEHQGFLTPDGEQAALDQWAWKLLACQRGLDCTGAAPWYRSVCLADPTCVPGEDGLGYIRRMVLDDYLRVQTRAAELGRHLDGAQWAALGLAGS
jgi:hypothetical protein